MEEENNPDHPFFEGTKCLPAGSVLGKNDEMMKEGELFFLTCLLGNLYNFVTPRVAVSFATQIAELEIPGIRVGVL